MHKTMSERLKTIGWREWVGLPAFDIETIKAKIDTGARTSSLHAFDLERFTLDGQEMVRFSIHPEQRSDELAATVEVPVLELRSVTPSSGHAEVRPVVLTEVALLGDVWQVELTLTNRDTMGFRMLLGRQAMRHRFVVDPSLSYQNGRRVKGTRRLKKRRPSPP